MRVASAAEAVGTVIGLSQAPLPWEPPVGCDDLWGYASEAHRQHHRQHPSEHLCQQTEKWIMWVKCKKEKNIAIRKDVWNTQKYEKIFDPVGKILTSEWMMRVNVK